MCACADSKATDHCLCCCAGATRFCQETISGYLFPLAEQLFVHGAEEKNGPLIDAAAHAIGLYFCAFFVFGKFLGLLGCQLFLNQHARTHTCVSPPPLCFGAAGALAAQMHWPLYHSSIKRMLGLVRRRADIRKSGVRALVQVLEAFHFDTRVSVSPKAAGRGSGGSEKSALDGRAKAAADSKGRRAGHGDDMAGDSDGDGDEETAAGGGDEAEDEAEEAVQLSQDDDDDGDGSDSEEENGDYDPEAVHRSMVSFVMPAIKRFMTYKDDERIVVRPVMVEALVSLLLLLPPKTLQLHLPPAINKVANVLKDRCVLGF